MSFSRSTPWQDGHCGLDASCGRTSVSNVRPQPRHRKSNNGIALNITDDDPVHNLNLTNPANLAEPGEPLEPRNLSNPVNLSNPANPILVADP